MTRAACGRVAWAPSASGWQAARIGDAIVETRRAPRGRAWLVHVAAPPWSARATYPTERAAKAAAKDMALRLARGKAGR